MIKGYPLYFGWFFWFILLWILIASYTGYNMVFYLKFNRSIDIFEGEPIWLNVSITGNQFKYLITRLSFTDIMPPYFKYKFFESFHIILMWKYNTNDVFIPYLLYMAGFYNKFWFCLRSDYIILNLLSYLYPLLLPFTSIVVGGGQYYVLLLEHYITSRRY